MEQKNVNEMSSEDLGLMIINLVNQRERIDVDITTIGNLLLERKSKTQTITPKENSDGTK